MAPQIDRLVDLALIEEVIAEMPDGGIVLNIDGTIAAVNRRVTQIFGYSKKQLLGQNIEMLVPEAVRTQHVSLRESFVKHPRSRSMGEGREIMGRHADGSEMPLLVSLAYVDTEHGIAPVAWVRVKDSAPSESGGRRVTDPH